VTASASSLVKPEAFKSLASSRVSSVLVMRPAVYPTHPVSADVKKPRAR
jgi:hypothetical protein